MNDYLHVRRGMYSLFDNSVLTPPIADVVDMRNMMSWNPGASS